MARSYKRDKNGRFASTGGGGGSGTRLSGRVTYRSSGSATGSSGTERNAGTGRKRALTMTSKNPNTGATRSARDLKENRVMNRKSEKAYNKTVASAGSGASSRGKSLRGKADGIVSTKRVAKSGKPTGIKTMQSAWGVTKGDKPSNRVVGQTKREKHANAGSFGGQQSINGARQVIASKRAGNKRQRVNEPSSGASSQGKSLAKSSGSLNKAPLSAKKKPAKQAFASIPALKSDPAADAAIRAKAAARKADEKARSDRAASDVIKYRMVGYRK